MTPRSMDKTASRVSDERLAEMPAGLDGVTPGPRHMYVSPTDILVTDDAGNNVAHFLPMDDDSQAYFVNATAFAHCDPETMRSILTELQSLRSLSSDNVSDGSKGVVERAEVNRVLQQAFGFDTADLLYQIITLKTALQPFAEASKRFDESALAVVGEVPPGSTIPAARFTHTQLRCARAALDSGTGGQQDVSGEQVMNVAGRIQSILSQKLTVEEGEIIGVGPASYKIARLFKPAPTEPKAGVVSEPFQARVAQAHIALFHDDPTDLAERRDRFGEEANELQQALGQTREDAHRLVDYTYDRPLGEPEKEIGSAALTLASLCVVGGWDMMACAEADLAALQTPEKIAKVRAKRATRHGRGSLPGLDPALLTAAEGREDE